VCELLIWQGGGAEGEQLRGIRAAERRSSKLGVVLT